MTFALGTGVNTLNVFIKKRSQLGQLDWVHFRGHEVRFKIRIGEHHVKTNQNLHTRV